MQTMGLLTKHRTGYLDVSSTMSGLFRTFMHFPLCKQEDADLMHPENGEASTLSCSKHVQTEYRFLISVQFSQGHRWKQNGRVAAQSGWM